jgi:hypothetical protein
MDNCGKNHTSLYYVVSLNIGIKHLPEEKRIIAKVGSIYMYICTYERDYKSKTGGRASILKAYLLQV